MTKEKVTAVVAAAIPRTVGPADSPPIAPHRVGLPERDEVDRLGLIGERRYIERILGTVKLAEKAGLAIALPGNHRNSVGLVEHVGRADVDADVAGRATGGIDDFDHSAASA